MTAHNCTTFDPSCYRCELGRDEMTAPEPRDSATHPTKRGTAADSWRPSMYSSVVPGQRRRKPPKHLQDAVLAAQEDCCRYCSLPFDATVIRTNQNGGRRFVDLTLNWDHFVPFSFLASNPHENWVAACSICNQIKSDLRFEDVEEAAEVIRRIRERKGYEPVSVAWDRLEAMPYVAYQRPSWSVAA